MNLSLETEMSKERAISLLVEAGFMKTELDLLLIH